MSGPGPPGLLTSGRLWGRSAGENKHRLEVGPGSGGGRRRCPFPVTFQRKQSGTKAAGVGLTCRRRHLHPTIVRGHSGPGGGEADGLRLGVAGRRPARDGEVGGTRCRICKPRKKHAAPRNEAVGQAAGPAPWILVPSVGPRARGTQPGFSAVTLTPAGRLLKGHKQRLYFRRGSTACELHDCLLCLFLT